LGDIDESNLFSYGDVTFENGPIQITTGIRADYFNFVYQDKLPSIYQLNSANTTKVSPKISLQYSFSNRYQLYTKFGKGFHSNDTRAIANGQISNTVPSAYGLDVGGLFKISKHLIFDVALWHLLLEQEFVYVGDAGIVEPSGQSQRQGLDLGIRFQPLPWLFIYTDINLANPISVEDPEGQNYIPLAPTFTNTGGLSLNIGNHMTGGIRYRHMGDRAANEDKSIVAKGYTIVDMNLNYSLKSFTLGLEINNLLNQQWNETQFATTSRLRQETVPVEDIHFTPGAPLFLKGKVTCSF
ncbi:MAG: TonB-dependent receptor, partial [Saprospiraceae bacterium]